MKYLTDLPFLNVTLHRYSGMFLGWHREPGTSWRKHPGSLPTVLKKHVFCSRLPGN